MAFASGIGKYTKPMKDYWDDLTTVLSLIVRQKEVIVMNHVVMIMKLLYSVSPSVC